MNILNKKARTVLLSTLLILSTISLFAIIQFVSSDSTFGTGSDGALTFTTTTKSYGNLVNNVDYTVSGDTLYLRTNRQYNFTSFTLGAGTTLSTQNTSGAGLCILSNNQAIIAGTVSLSNVANYGQMSSSFNCSGQIITAPSVANAGPGGAGGAGMPGYGDAGPGGSGYLGYGGGGGGGGVRVTTSLSADGGAGGQGGVNPVGGSRRFCGAEDWNNGYAGSQSGGGGGGVAQDQYDYGAYGGAGGSTHGANGENGYDGNNNDRPTAAGGGGGAGGMVGKQGYNFYLVSPIINFTGTINTAGIAGGNGGNGGNGDDYNNADAAGGGGGGGGGGGNAGNIYFKYGLLYNSSGTLTYNGGSGGSGGTKGTLRFDGFGTEASDGSAGSSGSSGTVYYTEDTSSLIPQINITSPTDTNNTWYNRKYVLINVTVSGIELTNITTNVYNSTSLVNSSNTTLTNLYSNLTVPRDGTYYFNSTACNSFGNCASTETRQVYLDADNLSICRPINTPGTYYLDKNISVTGNPSSCILIESENVTLDCQGNAIISNGARYYGLAYGITFRDTTRNLIIRNCKIYNFSSQIYNIGGVTNNVTIENNIVSSSLSQDIGLEIALNNSIIRNNIIGSTSSLLNVGIDGGGYNTVYINNTVRNNNTNPGYATYGMRLNGDNVRIYNSTISGFNTSDILGQGNLINSLVKDTNITSIIMENGYVWTNNTFLNTTETRINISGTGTNQLIKQWYLTGFVNSSYGPVDAASFQLRNSSNGLTHNLVTSSGAITQQAVTQFTYSNAIRTNHTPYNITVSKTLYATNSTLVNIANNYYHYVFLRDTTLPNATLNTPTNNTYRNNLTTNFTANLTDNLGIQNATLNIWNATSLVNQTTVSYAPNTFTASVGIVVTLIENAYNWFYSLFDWAGNNYVTGNRTVNIDLNNVSFCHPIQSAGTYYLDTNIIATGSCFDIQASNVLFDCNSKYIKGPASGNNYGIQTNGYSNITIQNCNITNFQTQINLTNSQNSAIKNFKSQGNTVTTFIGINLKNAVNTNLINLTMTNTTALNFYGIQVDSSNQTKLYNSTIYSNTGISNFKSYSGLNNNYNTLIQNTLINGVTESGYNLFVKDSNINNIVMSHTGATASRNNTLLNTTVISNWATVSSTTSVYKKWYLNLNVYDVLMNPLEGFVKIYDLNNQLLFAGTAIPSDGSISTQQFSEDFYNETNRYYLTPHFINTTLSGYVENDTYVNLTETNNPQVNIILIGVDVTPPTVNILYPTNSNYSLVSEMNVSIFDASSLSSCWYTLDNGLNNYTFFCIQNITGLASLQGMNTWNVYAEDSRGNIGNNSVTFYSDQSAPTVTLNTPANNTLTTNTNNNFTVNLTDDLALSNATLFIYNSTSLVNQTTVYTNALTTTIGIVVNLVDNVYNWFYQVFDLMGNSQISNNQTITIDTTSPIVNITFPLAQTYSSLNELNFTIIENNGLSSCAYSFDGGINNYTITCVNQTGITYPEGNGTITVYAIDTLGHIGSNNVSFYNDIPTITQCRDLTITNQIYTLQNDIMLTSNSSCFKILSNNITLNLNGKNLSYNSLREATNSPRELNAMILVKANYTTIRNGTITNAGRGILTYDEVKYEHIENLIFNDVDIPIWVTDKTANNNGLIENNIINGISDNLGDILIGDQEATSQYNLNITVKNNNFNNCFAGVYVLGPGGNNYIFNNTANSCTYGLAFIDDSLGNIFEENKVYNSETAFVLQSNAIYINNIFKNNTNYYIDPTGYNTFIWNNSFGEVKYLTNYNTLGFAIANDLVPGETINITNNSILVIANKNPSKFPNEPANLTLYNIGNRGFVLPAILRDGVTCTDCYNFTSLTASTVIFNVTGFSNYSIGEDTQYPNVQIVSPINGETYTQTTIDFNYTVSDNNLGSCWYSDDGAANQTITCGTNTTITHTEGTYYLTLYVNDTQNHLNSTTIIYSISTTAPTVNLLTPVTNSYLNTSSVNLNFSTYDSDGTDTCELWGNWSGWHLNQSIVSPTQSASIGFNVSLSQGSYIWNVKCNDTLGNSIYSLNNFTFILDLTNPIGLSNTPANNTYTNLSSVNFTANLSDNYGLTNATLYINNVANQTTILSGIQNMVGIVVTMADGVYNWFYQLFDLAGNSAITETRNLTIDTTYPQISFGTGTLDSGVNVSQSNIYINVTYSETNFANITFRTNVGSYFNNTGIALWNFTGLANGIYSYNVTICDLINQCNTTQTRTITLDTLNPNVNLISPVNNIISGSNVNFTANITDNLGIKNATLGVYNSTYNYCYQESPNVATACGGLSTGIYFDDGTFDWSLAYDGDWDTQVTAPVTEKILYINYTIPVGVTLNESYWIVKYNYNDAISYPIGEDCSKYGGSVLQLRLIIRQTVGGPVFKYVIGACQDENALDWPVIFEENPLSGIVYEEAMNWSIGTLVNQTTVTYAPGVTNSITGIVVNLADNIYTWFYTVYDWANNFFISFPNLLTNSNQVIVDTANPTIVYESNTEANNSIYNRDNIFINVTSSDSNFANMSIYVYNETGLVNQTNYFTRENSINLTSLTDGVYYFNATVTDLANKKTSTETRKVTIDTMSPSFTFLSPLNQTYTSTFIAINLNPSETIAEYKYTLDNGLNNNSFANPTTVNFNPGSNNLKVYVTDLANNTNSSSVVFYVSYTDLLNINLSTSSTPEIGSNISLIALTTTDNTDIVSCNFSLRAPSGIIFNNQLGTGLTTWQSSYYQVLLNGTYNYNVTCTNEFGITNRTSSNFTVSPYVLSVNPTDFNKQVRAVKTEIVTQLFEIYDNVNSNMNYTVTTQIENPSNFTLTYPNSFLLNTTDSISNPRTFNFTIQAGADTTSASYLGNITLTNNLLGTSTVIPFTFTVNPPSAIPILYDTASTRCSDDGLSCLSTLSIQQGSSTTKAFKMAKIGNFAKASNCSIIFDNELVQSWISVSPKVFDLVDNIVTNPSLVVTISPTGSTTATNYQGYMKIRCNQSDSLGYPADSDNRVKFDISVTTSTVPIIPGGGGGGSGTGTEIDLVNLTQTVTQGICGNRICEDGTNGTKDFRENYQSCPGDCPGNLGPITDCFNGGPNCILKAGTAIFWIGGFILLILLLTSIIEVRKKGKGQTVSYLPTMKISKRR